MRMVFIVKGIISYRLSILTLILFFSLSLLAQDTLYITKDSHTIDEVSNRKIKDPGCSKTAEEIKFDTLLENEQQINNCYWTEIILKNTTKNQTFSLEIVDPHFDYVEVFKKTTDGFESLTKSGFSVFFNFRKLQHKNHVALLEIGKNESLTLYIKSSVKVDVADLARIKPMSDFINYALSEYIFLGIFYGILILLLIYNLVLFFTNKQKYYLWYIFYILCCSINTFNENGLGFQYLWPKIPSLNYFFYSTGALWLGLSFLFYAKSFLGKKVLPLKVTIVLSVALMALHFIFKIEFIKHHWALTFIAFFGYLLYLSTNKFKNFKRSLSYFTVGNSLLFFSFIVLYLRIFDLIPNFWLTVYFFNFGFVIEGIVFSYAMAQRLNTAHEKLEDSQQKMILELKEKEALKDKVNRELEEKVKERTILVEQQKLELISLNDELKEYHKKIDYINSELDKDNYKLKRSLSEAKKEKILKRIVNYEDFGEVFKSQNDCIKHLIELKWAEGFKCKKCKSKSFSLVAKTQNRKCTSCKHIESPTANTIFHGIKFPLDKAFFLVYLTHYGKKEFTIDELSEELSLRRNTLWSFKKKVIERKEHLLKENKIVANSPWERLIVD